MKNKVFDESGWPLSSMTIQPKYVDRKGLSVLVNFNGFSAVITAPDGAAIDEVGRQLGIKFRSDWLHSSVVRTLRQNVEVALPGLEVPND